MTIEEYIEMLNKDYLGWDNSYSFVIKHLKDNTPFAYSRFNDGEMMGIQRVGSVAARGDQVISKDLQLALLSAITHKQKNYYIGVPCSICYPTFNDLANNLIGEYQQKVSAVALTNRNWAKFISELPEAMKDKRVKFISGNDQRLKILEKKLNFNVVKHIITTSRDSWANIDEIRNHISDIDDGDIVFISLGPSARVLVKEWFETKPNATFIDIGSVLDPFTRNVWHNCHKGWENGFNITKKCNNCN